jgi:hypothetical protein
VLLKAKLVLLAVEPWFGSGIHVPMMPLPAVVVVILAVATWLDASCQVGDQGICLSAVAIVYRRSPTSDGLATAWQEARQPTRWQLLRDPAAWKASRCKAGGTRPQEQARRSRSAWTR